MNVCYVASDHKTITKNIKFASKRRFMQGKRNCVVVDSSLITMVRSDIKTGTIKVSFSQSLIDRIYDAVISNEQGGSFLLDGSTPTYGYAVGGARLENRPAGCIILNGDEVTDKGDIVAALELMREEVERAEYDFPNQPVMIGFWKEFGEICFDASSWVVDETAAANMAFKINNEWAYYDFSNSVSVFLEDYLIKNDMSLDAFVGFKKATRKYREAGASTQKLMRHAWFLNKFNYD